MIAALVKFFVVGLAAVVALALILGAVGLIFSVASVALGLAGFLLFKVLPIVLIGYLIVRFLAPKQKRLNAADREWLETE
jgi:hypothetical protein